MKAALTLALLLLSACHAPINALRAGVGITGGSDVSPESDLAHATVLIMTVEFVNTQEDPIFNQCTGTLISSDLVVTAAHCFVPSEGVVQTQRMVIFKTSVDDGPTLQNIFQTHDGVEVQPGDVVVNENYHRVVDERGAIDVTQKQYDVALIHLSQRVPASARPIPLLRDASLLHVGDSVIQAGYGPPTEGEHLPLRLRMTSSKIVDLLQMPVGQLQVANSFVNGPKGPSLGDSGGPGVVLIDGKPYLFGVYSVGQAYDLNLTSGYERIPDFIDWIEAQAKRFGAAT